MTNHIQEQLEADMLRVSVPSIDDVQEDEVLDIESEETTVDYSGFTRKEMVDHFRELLDSGEIDAVRNELDAIKFHFYKKLKAEEDVKRTEYLESGGIEDDFVFEDEQELEFKGVLGRYREIRNIQNERLEAEKQKNLEEKLKIIEELKDLAKGSESISETFHQFRNLQNRWRTIGLVPQNEVKNLWDTYHHFVELFYDYIKINKDLRDLDFKRNLAAKIELCEKTEALILEPSVVNAFKSLQTYHEQWREIGPVTQEMRVEIWERFKAASSQVNKKHQSFFDNLRDTQNKHKEAKEALCERIDEILQQPITTTNQWIKLTQEILEIQKLWNTIGSANKKDNGKLFRRFHSLCDKFFAKKREFSGNKKEEQENNLQLKQDLCVQAEALKDSTEWRATTEEFVSLQEKWSEIGVVPSKNRDEVWKRFRKACDYFFEQKSKYYSAIDAEYENNLKAKRAIISKIKNFKQSANPKESFEELKDLQRQWSEIGFVPMKQKQKIQDEYREAINSQFEALRIEDGEKNRMMYKSKIETMVSAPKSHGKLGSERDKLARKLQQLQSDLVIWENNIGFFSKSKKSEAMVASVQRMIENGKAEMRDLQEKIKIIDTLGKR